MESGTTLLAITGSCGLCFMLNVNYNIDDYLGEGDDYHLLHRRSIVCEDLPAQNIQFVRNENPNVRIP